MEPKGLINAYLESRSSTDISEAGLDYARAGLHVELVKRIEQISGLVGIVWDYNRQSPLYVSGKFPDRFGFKTENMLNETLTYFLSRMHEIDAQVLLKGALFAWDKVQSLPETQRKDYEMRQEFRMVNDLGEWIRITMHDIILEVDHTGKFWINMKLFDSAPTQNMELPGSIVCVNIKTGRFLFTDIQIKQQVFKLNISVREIEILVLLNKGFTSKEIGKKLYISDNTVNNHRRNILRKLAVSNTAQATSQLREMGFL